MFDSQLSVQPLICRWCDPVSPSDVWVSAGQWQMRQNVTLTGFIVHNCAQVYRGNIKSCILKEKVCDGNTDCDDNADERLCTFCVPGQAFLCQEWSDFRVRVFFCSIIFVESMLFVSVAQPGSGVTTDPTALSSPGVMSSTVPGVALLLGIIKIRKYRKGHTNRIKILSFLLYFMLLQRERGKYNLTVRF